MLSAAAAPGTSNKAEQSACSRNRSDFRLYAGTESHRQSLLRFRINSIKKIQQEEKTLLIQKEKFFFILTVLVSQIPVQFILPAQPYSHKIYAKAPSGIVNQ